MQDVHESNEQLSQTKLRHSVEAVIEIIEQGIWCENTLGPCPVDQVRSFRIGKFCLFSRDSSCGK